MASGGDYNHMAQAIEAIHQGIKDGIAKAAKEGAKIATDTAPRDTGYMADHVYSVTADASSYQEGEKSLPEVEKPGDMEAVIASAATYSEYVEFGTRHMPAQPFMAPMADTVRGQLAGIIADSINARLGK